MERGLSKHILKDLKRKIILISGPRQAGKTTLAKSLNEKYEYVNFDYPEHRKILKERSWDRKKDVIIFDEIHKMQNWKTWLKGIYDVEGIPPSYLVTGSAKLDMMRKAGDSLAGRFFSYRLHPLDIKETSTFMKPEEAFRRISEFGGFPEPFLENDPTFYGKWARSHVDSILRQDLLDLESLRDIKSIESLIEILRYRTGSPISTANLARDLERDPKTIKNWLRILEDLFVVFSVRPYYKNLTRALLKEPKYYFYDSGRVMGDEGVKLENITACALKKEIDRIEDTQGIRMELRYIRNKERKEIDFAVIAPSLIWLIETKASDGNLSPHFALFAPFLGKCKKIQLVKNLNREKTYPDGCEIRKAAHWLAHFCLLPDTRER